MFSISSTLLNRSVQQMFLNIQPSSPKWKNQNWPGVGSVERWIQWREFIYTSPGYWFVREWFSKKIVLRLSLNRSLASFTLIDLAAFIFFQETSRNRLVYFYNRSSTFYFILFFLLRKKQQLHPRFSNRLRII